MGRYFRVSYYDSEEDIENVYVFDNYNKACGQFYTLVYNLHGWCDWYEWNSIVINRERNEYTPECDNLICKNSGIIIKLVEQECLKFNSEYDKDTLIMPICLDETNTMFLLPTIPVYYNKFRVGYFMYKADKFKLLQAFDGRILIYPIDDIGKLEYDDKYGNLQEALINAIAEGILD